MPKNQDSIKEELRGLLKTRGYSPEMFDSSGKSAPVPQEAELVQFEFKKDGKDYGPVTIGIDGSNKMNIYFGDDVANSPSAGDEDDLSWSHLLNHLKRFAIGNNLRPNSKDIDDLKYDMAKRDYNKREGLREGYHSMGKKQSYNDVIPETKIIIKHSRNIEEGEQRYRNVERIFIENAVGERILAPTTKPGIAQVYARHIAEGGLPHDERWNHIKGLCEEYSKMAGFVRATRGKQFNESAQKLVESGLNHYVSLRESLSKMRGKKGYNNYFESWTPPLMEDEVSGDLSEMFMSSSLDPRIESVMPILSKLNKNLTESPMAEVVALEDWVNEVTTDQDEVDYGDKYQDMVSRVGKKAKEQEKRKPVDIKDLARRLHAIGTKQKDVSEGEITPVPTGHKGLNKQQKAAGQVGPAEKFSTGPILGAPEKSEKGLRGRLVGAESVDHSIKNLKKLSGL